MTLAVVPSGMQHMKTCGEITTYQSETHRALDLMSINILIHQNNYTYEPDVHVPEWLESHIG